MQDSHRPLLAPLAFVGILGLLSGSCGPRETDGRPIESLELIDFSAPGMFKQLGAQLGEPYVLELPPWSVNDRHELRMSQTTTRAVLEELCRLDPSFQFSMKGPALLMWPTGRDEVESPFSRQLEHFTWEGGVQSALQELISTALPRPTTLVSAAAGQARPVSLHAHGMSVRELLVEIAAQAHLAIVVEPGYIRVSEAPD